MPGCLSLYRQNWDGTDGKIESPQLVKDRRIEGSEPEKLVSKHGLRS